jgi:hypothetical protein
VASGVVDTVLAMLRIRLSAVVGTVMWKRSIRKIAWLAAVTALGAPLGFSQDTSTLKPPLYRGVTVHVSGVFVTPVPGVPLTAIVEVESTQVLADGATASKKTINNIGRDFKGRIYNERRRLVSTSFTGTPRLVSFHLYDPLTRVNTFLDPATHIARQTTRPVATPDGEEKLASPGAVRDPLVEEEELGTETMEKLLVHGLRRSRTLPAAVSGTGKPVVIIDEYWYSEELHLNILVKHDDPRSGHQMVTVTHVHRSEPDAAMFEIPAGYKVVDETPENETSEN